MNGVVKCILTVPEIIAWLRWGWHSLYQGLLLPPQGGEQEIVSHPLTALEHYLPEL